MWGLSRRARLRSAALQIEPLAVDVDRANGGAEVAAAPCVAALTLLRCRPALAFLALALLLGPRIVGLGGIVDRLERLLDRRRLRGLRGLPFSLGLGSSFSRRLRAALRCI
jgi:hypothetical protein